ncbi:hypothetical protein OTB20_34135 [Streptomyces sp. H27-H1]|uniref:hypothetical protein n=1 Tax=unclassified Streptomyces TaxID=2593676 RepID=UPI00226E3BB4|nr:MULTISPECIES: hypothetical protein [unclassified Streptomyces]MCY0931138.1 hypothetical protein [Streptomyces sp. H27-H1]MCY0939654.1 hypothetical protein [Streptomyces sp. H34-S4]
MEQKTVSPPERAGFAQLAEEFWQVSDAPIYDAVESQWLAEGREVPRRPGLAWGGRLPVNAGDLFHRA